MNHPEATVSNPFDDYLTKQQFCESFPGGPISEKSAERWHTLRVGPPRIKVGRRILYPKRGVRQWLEAKAPSMVRESVQ